MIASAAIFLRPTGIAHADPDTDFAGRPLGAIPHQ
jgi:hypothetical protein